MQPAILAAWFLSKNSPEKRTICLFLILPGTLFTHLRYHLKGMSELITPMPSKVEGQPIFIEEMSGTSALSIFCTGLSDLKIVQKSEVHPFPYF